MFWRPSKLLVKFACLTIHYVSTSQIRECFQLHLLKRVLIPKQNFPFPVYCFGKMVDQMIWKLTNACKNTCFDKIKFFFVRADFPTFFYLVCLNHLGYLQIWHKTSLSTLIWLRWMQIDIMKWYKVGCLMCFRLKKSWELLNNSFSRCKVKRYFG